MSDGDLWRIVDRAIRARGHKSVAITKTKGHATEGHLDTGVSTPWERFGNEAADRYAKRGALLHPVNPWTEKVRLAVQSQVKLVACYVARLAARMGEEIPRDSTGRKRSGMSSRAKRAAQRAAEDDGSEAEVHHVAASLTAAPTGPVGPHRWERLEYSRGVRILACRRCGAYVSLDQRHRVRLVAAACRGRDGVPTQRDRIRRGLYPQGGDAHADLVLVDRLPVSQEELQFEAGPTERVARSVPGSGVGMPPAPQGLHPSEIMAMVGLTAAEVEARCRKLASAKVRDEAASDDEAREGVAPAPPGPEALSPVLSHRRARFRIREDFSDRGR